ncbi:CLIP-associating protein 1-B-like isoform X12 [Clavelina lepadiformis]|uniref:CLIP-associating protein 1-B-like isoform X12 n=1 Tax=Clavelina lepadiformis TaxID=159417 RepID=UPI0040433EAF
MKVDEDNALLLVREQDMKRRMNGGEELIEYLASPAADITFWTNIDKIVDALATYWVSSSNFKVALLGLDILSLLVERLQQEFQPHYNLIQNPLIDRLGDQKDQVRDASITLLTNIMDVAASPQYLFERLTSAFSHKVWRVREGVCRLLVATINRFGAKSLYLSKLLPHVCKLLSDANAQVRDTAVTTIVEIYRHVGDKVRQDLSKKGVPASKLHMLYEKFDVVLQSGDMVIASDTGSIASSIGSFDSVDSISSAGMMLPPLSNVVANNNNSRSTLSHFTSVDGPARPSTGQARKSVQPPRSSLASSRSNAGAVDEESFIRDFDQNLPPIRLHSARDLEDQLNRVHTTLAGDKKDWEERTKTLKVLRAIILAGGTDYEAFYQHLRNLEPALQKSAKDLRSQVVRETCVTIGFLSSSIKNRFEHSACALLPNLFMLIPNSAKVMSTSGVLCIRTILKHTHCPRLIPVVTGYCTSKTTSIRRHTFTFLDVMFQNWVTQLFDKHVVALKDSVQRGINDADSEAREEARRAWHGLNQHFPVEADQVFNSLNASQQKLIKGQISGSSSIDNLSKGDTAVKKPRSSIATTTVGPRRHIPKAPPSSGLRAAGVENGNTRFLRSRSDIDPAAVKRSKMKAMKSGYGTVGRPSRVNPRISSTSTTNKTPAKQDRGRDSDRPSMSQRSLSATRWAGSRSNSPGTQRRLQALSRTPNTGRTSKYSSSSTGHDLSPSYAGRNTSSTTGGIPPMRVLPKGREGEQALTDALSRKLQRRNESYGISDNDDDMSDTSSVCSDRSSSYSSRNGLKRHQSSEDIVEILQLCQSSLWTERKEGLTGLHALINKHKDFSRLQLKKILEIFNRMFADPHGKATKRVFSMFLEMLPDFINIYKEQIHEWLYILLTQLLKKMGADLLGSVQAKVLKALQVTRESFPTELQFNILSRYIVDQTQRPSLKVKVALLHYMLELLGMMEASEISNTSDTRLALSRIITWTTEPKSQDVRKIAEALVISVFELNAPIFTKMIHVLPKTFQDGAMKVLYSYMKSNGETTSSTPSDSSSGQVMGRIAVSPSRNVISPRGSVGTLDLMSPRGSITTDGENMNQEEIAENFRDITAGIQKLRMDSSADDLISRKHSYSSNTSPSHIHANLAASPVFAKPSFSSAAKERLNLLTKASIGRQSNYNPTSYSDISPTYNKQNLRDAIFDEDDDSFNEDFPIDHTDSNIAEVANALTSSNDKRRALDNLSRTLRSSDLVGGLAASQQQIQWDQYFNSVLNAVLEILRTGNLELQLTSLNVMQEMLRHLSNRFKNFAEVTIIHILEAHKDSTKELVRAAEETGMVMCSVLPPLICIRVLSPLTRSNNNEGVQACLKMLTNAINRCSSDELSRQTVTELVPGLLQCYDNPESGIRKAAVFCLVALHRIIGDAELCQHLTSLPGGKMKLLQLYIKRSQANASGAGDA